MLNRYNLIIDTKDWGIKMQAMDKVERVLGIYTKLINGAVVNKTQTANEYGVNERSIQRDIDDIRNYLELEAEKEGVINNVIYDRMAKGYKLEQIYHLKYLPRKQHYQERRSPRISLSQLSSPNNQLNNQQAKQ